MIPEPINSPVYRDRDDDVVLGTALAGGCVTIVTGDQNLAPIALAAMDLGKHVYVQKPAHLVLSREYRAGW